MTFVAIGALRVDPFKPNELGYPVSIHVGRAHLLFWGSGWYFYSIFIETYVSNGGDPD